MKKQKEKKPRQPMTKQRRRELVIWLAAVAVFLIASILVGPPGRSETVQETMRDAVLHETNRVSLFSIKDVNPGLISAMLVSAFLLVAAALIRIFAIPRFKMIPGKFQLLLEQLVSLFDGLARGSSPHRNGFLGAYIFAAGVYIFTGTLSELIGVQVMATNGHAVTLPAPLSDVNAAIALGCLSYLIILSGGIAGDGVKGVGKTLKEFSLPDLDELPSVRRAAEWPAGDGAGVLLCEPELRAAGGWWACCSPCSTRSSRATCSPCSPPCSTARSPSRRRRRPRKAKSQKSRA